MHPAPATLLLAALTAPLAAQSKLTTLFASDNSGASGGVVFFDLTVTNAVAWLALESNYTAGAGTPVGVTVYTTPGTHAGKELDASAWTLAGTDDGAAVAAGLDQPTAIALQNPIPLVPGSYGVALVAAGSGHAYTNGTPGNRSYADLNLMLQAGAAGNTPFTGLVFSPRVWNGTVCYQLAAGLIAEFDAAPRSGASPLIVQLNDRSVTSTPPITAWSWDIDNDGTADYTDQNPAHTYTAGGRYTVKLDVTDGSHGTVSKTAADFIEVDIVAAELAAAPRCGAAPLAVQLTDLSTHGPTSWQWDVDNDGTTDYTDQNPAHTYALAGRYTVALTAANAVSSDTATELGLIEVLAANATNNDASPALLEYQFNELRGDTVANTASTDAAPPAGQVANAGWHDDPGRAGYRGNEPGFGCLGDRAGTIGENWVETGWPLDARNLTVMWWLRLSALGVAQPDPFGYAFGGPGGTVRAFVAGAAGRSIAYRGSPIGDVFATRDLVTGRAGVWQHVALVVDDTRGAARWYFDGVLDVEQPFAPGTHQAANTGFRVGRHQSLDTLAAWAAIDDFRVYGAALTAAEIQSAMAAENPTTAPGGSGCPGPNGEPELTAGGGAPRQGNSAFELRGNNLEAGVPAALVLGYLADAGGTLPIDLSWLLGAGCGLETLPEITLAVAQTGSFVVAAPLPVLPGLGGSHAYAQIAVIGSAGAASRRLDVHIE